MNPQDVESDEEPSSRVAEPDDVSGDTVAPRNQDQSDLVLRTIKDLLENDAVTPDLEDATGMTKAEMEQFVKKYERVETEPAGPGREIEVTPGESGEGAGPSAGLPPLPNHARTTRNITDRGSMPQDDARGNIEGFRFAPPAEFRGRVESYKNALSRSRPSAASQPAPGGDGK